MQVVYERPKFLKPVPQSYCPGCNHGTAVKLVTEVLEEMGVMGDTIAVLPIGCAPLMMTVVSFDFVVAAHGRAPAVATGVKRCRPDKFVFTYQGDGDLASIGTAEIVHAANRGEKLSVVFVNNGIFGMTGGQMAPTTLDGQWSTTTQKGGRNPEIMGHPIRVCEMLNTLEAPVYIERCALNNVANIRAAKKAIRKAFEIQKNNEGFAFVELLSACPTNWKLTPEKCAKRIDDEVIPYFPLGVFRDKTKEAK